MIKNGSLGHAYLFVGPDDKMKKDFALWLCEQITGWGFENNPNLRFISPDPEATIPTIKIGQIRNVRSFVALKPYSASAKLVIVENAETINEEAANAFLKTLEEPPAHSLIVLMATKPKAMPTTILSRCEKVFFHSSGFGDSAEHQDAFSDLRKLLRQGISEKIKYAKIVQEEENYAELVNVWLSAASVRLNKEPSLAPVVRGLLRLSQAVSHPGLNHRLALERFLISNS